MLRAKDRQRDLQCMERVQSEAEEREAFERRKEEAERLLEERRLRIEKERLRRIEELRQWEESRAYYRGLSTLLSDSLAASGEYNTSNSAGLPTSGVDLEKPWSRELAEHLADAIRTIPGGSERRVAYLTESRQVVVEYDLLSKEDAIDPILKLKVAERKSCYAAIIAQTALAVLHKVFRTEQSGLVESVVFNGHVRSIDPATGHDVHPCIVSLRTTRDVFERLNLRKVDPVVCLKGLRAEVSRKPEELVPVRPVLEFSMVDQRFVEEQEVLSSLDSRINLMDLTPKQFESLISDLFSRMGLETRQTRPSRDGGVDCVAYDQRPILGGKVIIQAKRYKNTVGVSAVRDLFGTLQNEGASKGILVTTSGYGKASFEFAANKPLELLSGSHLLFLLKEHAGIEARIEVPEDWKNPSSDTVDEM